MTLDGVALDNMTPLVQLDVTGPGTCVLLKSATSNDIDVAPGRVAYTLLLDGNGGVRSSLTVTRLGPENFRMGANLPQNFDALCWHAGDDITGGTCGLGL